MIIKFEESFFIKKKLSISIPTFNREEYLRDLLESIYIQVKKKPLLLTDVSIYVFDNNSTDNTNKIVEEIKLPIFYKKNKENIGGDPNILQAYSTPNADYVWVVGDDEILPNSSLKYILKNINKYSPSLIINRTTDLRSCIPPKKFTNYTMFTKFAEKCNPNILIAHSLISANIIKKELFKADLSKSLLEKTCYCNFFALVYGVLNSERSIIIPRNITIYVRKRRAKLYNEHPNTILDLNQYVVEKQKEYLISISNQLGLRINPLSAIDQVKLIKYLFFTLLKYPLSIFGVAISVSKLILTKLYRHEL